MSARVSAEAPKLAVVAQSGATVACMAASGDQLLFRADSVAHATYQASILRGLLADAYLAGRAAAQAECGHPVGYVNPLSGDCTLCHGSGYVTVAGPDRDGNYDADDCPCQTLPDGSVQ